MTYLTLMISWVAIIVALGNLSSFAWGTDEERSTAEASDSEKAYEQEEGTPSKSAQNGKADETATEEVIDQREGAFEWQEIQDDEDEVGDDDDDEELSGRGPASKSKVRKKRSSQGRRASQVRKGQFEGQPIVALRIEGHKKIERDAILARIKTREGETLQSDKIRKDVLSLFGMEYFYNIEVDAKPDGKKGITLTYKVTEKPSISEIKYDGNSEVNDDDLIEASGLKAYQILNMSKVNKAIEKMVKLYEDKGFFLARINYELTDDTPGEGVKLRFKIEENDHVVLKKITILGNYQISDQRIKSVMSSQEGGFFSFLSGSGSFKQDAFDRDMAIINYLYYNEGFVDVKIDRPQVYVTPDKKSIYITLRVEEGIQYHVGEVDFAGDLLFSEKELLESIEIKDSDIFAYDVLQRDISNLQAKYGDLGYAFANVIPRPRRREKDKKVDVTFEFEKGHKVYFGQINVVGNSRTRDKVVRRELQIREGELYNETRKRESLANVQRLGYFDEVQFNTSTPEGHPDLLNIDITVKERNTGSIQVGAGYSSYSGATFQGQVNQSNLFGYGYKLGASAQIDKNGSFYNLNFTDPYFLDTKWSAGIDLYQSQRATTNYTEVKTGGALRMGHPLAPYLMGYLRYKYEDAKITVAEKADPTLFSGADGSTSSLTATLEYDKRNDRFAPSEGIFGSVSLEYAGIGGTKKYTKGFTSGRYYHTVFWKVVFRNNLTYAFITPHDEQAPPFNELFLLGGANNLRGFQWYTIGKKIFSQKKCDGLTPACQGAEDSRAFVEYGGTQQAYYNAELEFPLISEAGIKGVVFYDVGYADDILRLSDFRSDFGFGFRWFSPIGPLRFEWGFPVNRNAAQGEESYNFNFMIGSPF